MPETLTWTEAWGVVFDMWMTPIWRPRQERRNLFTHSITDERTRTMWKLKVYDQYNQWFSTVTIDGWYVSDHEICRCITEEVEANRQHWTHPVTFALFHNNQDVSYWYEQVTGNNLNSL